MRRALGNRPWSLSWNSFVSAGPSVTEVGIAAAPFYRYHPETTSDGEWRRLTETRVSATRGGRTSPPTPAGAGNCACAVTIETAPETAPGRSGPCKGLIPKQIRDTSRDAPHRRGNPCGSRFSRSPGYFLFERPQGTPLQFGAGLSRLESGRDSGVLTSMTA